MTILPIASAKDVRSYALRLALRHPGELGWTLFLHTLGALSGLIIPWLLGGLVANAVRGVGDATGVVPLICAAIGGQAILTAYAVRASARLGEKLVAELREEFIDDVLALPLGVVENAGSGDLISRSTWDVAVLSRIVRYVVPSALLSVTTIVITVGALFVVGPLIALPCLIAVPILWFAARWYLRRARDGYLRQSLAYSKIMGGLTETTEGARTVEALGIGHRRIERADLDIAEAYAAERYTLRLRTVFLPISDVTYILPVVTALVVGGFLYIDGIVTLAVATAATLYTQRILGPVDALLSHLGELQAGAASLARVLGVSRSHHQQVSVQSTPKTPETPAPAPVPIPRGAHRAVSAVSLERGDIIVASGVSIVASGVSFAYQEGRDVLHDIDLEIFQGERLAIVGPSGAGKSTLGRLLAGVDEPRTGSITIGATRLTDLPIARLREHVALVTQEHHVFGGTIRDNLAIAAPNATDKEYTAALQAVFAWDWVRHVGLDTPLGPCGAGLAAAQIQQLSLARLILADPQVLVLDEATSLLDPRAARDLERSLAAVLGERTVIAIAHRLHTAYDADRIAVIEDGRVIELGGHAELLDADGAYAALWNSWHGRGSQIGV